MSDEFPIHMIGLSDPAFNRELAFWLDHPEVKYGSITPEEFDRLWREFEAKEAQRCPANPKPSTT